MMGGIIVTYASWRVIYWVQFSMTCLAIVLAVTFIPTALRVNNEGRTVESDKESHTHLHMMEIFNPMEVFKQMRYPTVLLSVSLHQKYAYLPC